MRWRQWLGRTSGAPGERHRVRAVLWYEPEQWEALRDASEDTQDLGSDYESWLAAAEVRVEELERTGHQVFRVQVDTSELQAWCRRNQLALTAEVRARYASEKAGAQQALERRIARLRACWRLWLVASIVCVTVIFLWRWYATSPVGSADTFVDWNFWFFLLPVGLMVLSALTGAGVFLYSGVQALRHRGALRGQYVRLGAIALLAMALLFSPRWIDGFHQSRVSRRACDHGQKVASAIHRYQDVHGHPPPALRALVPRYLETIPSTGIGACPSSRSNSSLLRCRSYAQHM